ncbi:E3 ubiquitin-protein ligase UPL3-like [Lactuca sativa]|uniref:E3 ubiquitin-protein ligase UPL3-like n=1 Tax=Lactuca sativa TaxID=4236 RepID=UPI0022B02525|nr:E3 ubiquitin-protein ligase UPL3-like [Lactuca sativa]
MAVLSVYNFTNPVTSSEQPSKCFRHQMIYNHLQMTTFVCMLLCGRREMWEADTLVEHIKFDHGYTSKSPVVINLLEIMGEFNPEQQRAFCQFVTGAPQLPPGGLAVLNPKLTIVRKLQSSNNTASNAAGGVSESADDDLPSVMACANYLTLPPYSTKFYLVSDIAVKELIAVATNREDSKSVVELTNGSSGMQYSRGY